MKTLVHAAWQSLQNCGRPKLIAAMAFAACAAGRSSVRVHLARTLCKGVTHCKPYLRAALAAGSTEASTWRPARAFFRLCVPGFLVCGRCQEA